MSLNAEVAAFLDLVNEGREAGRAAMHELPVAQGRADFERSSQDLAWQVAGRVTVSEHQVATRDGASLPVRLYLPADEAPGNGPWPVLVYFHGGGFVVGSLDSHDSVCREFSWRTPCAVLSVGYRLAPEYPFPTPVHDAEDAVAWLVREANGLNLDSGRLALGGDSAGGTLAAVLAIMAAQGLLPLPQAPVLQLLFYPITDASSVSVSADLFDEGYLLETATLEWFYGYYAPDPQSRLDWRVSPLLAPDVQGVAKAFIALAGFDPLLDEGKAYAHRLADAGVAVTLRCYEGMTHDFLRMGSITAEALGLYEEFTAVLAQAFSPD